MARASRDKSEVNARIVYWGVEGCGKTANLKAIYANLRADHRGELRELPTRLDPTVHYHVLPIELGAIAGVRTRIEVVAVPGRPDQAPTRKQLLDEVDGLVLVLDSRGERIDENIQSFEELRQALAAYGRSLDDVPLVVQYNKRDLADSYALEDLHRKLDLHGAAVFEAVATEGTAVLQTLSTISKCVIRNLREEAAPQPATPTERLESAILQEEEHPDADAIVTAARRTESLLDSAEPMPFEIDGDAGVRLGPDLSIVSVGQASRSGERSVRVPVVLGDSEGRTSTLVLTIQLDPLLDEAPD
jgi:signal recognition particle receptor subunit beta